MSRRWLVPVVAGCLVSAWALAGPPQSAVTERLYRLDLAVRKAGEEGVTPKTWTVAVEVFLDKKARRLFYVGPEGNPLAVAAAPEGAANLGKAPLRLRRLVLPVRTAAEKDFSADTGKLSVEVYHDANTGHLVYISEKGAFAVMPAPKDVGKAGGEAKWLYRLPLGVRPYREFEARPVPCNVEVYEDPRAGCLVYAAESGAVAVLAAGAKAGAKDAKPEWSYALDLKARAPGVNAFDAKTPTFGVEIFVDAGAGAWVYLTEARHLAVMPGAKAGRLRDVKAPEWRQAVAAGDVWAAESYADMNSGHLVFINARGALAAAPVPMK